MKKILLFLFLSCSFNLMAQDFSITGQVLNEKQGEALVGAYITLLYPWDEEVKSTATDVNGNYELKNVEQGGYKLKFSYLGYADLIKEVTVDAAINFGTTRLKEGGLNLDEVQVTEKLPLATQLGDTTQYNADAFKTLPDATAEQLIEKMPGVIVDGGKVQAQGEDVTQVLVDGKPFFGNDPTAALRNLPAEVISKIQVFDQESEQSQFSGFSDGETTKTINIITRKDMKVGQFGKIYAGYGYENKYDAGGNMSIFDGSRRISLIGQSNNINIQNFASEDLLGVVGGGGRRGRGGRGGGRRGGRGGGGRGGSANDFLISAQNGIASTNAFGINYSDQLGKKVELTGSYFFNWTDTDETENLERTYLDTETGSEIYDESNLSNSKNINHRLNMRINWKIDSVNELSIRPRLSFQQNDGFAATFGETNTSETLLNQTDNKFNAQLSGIDFDNSLSFRHRFAKRGRTTSLSLRTSYNDKKGDSDLYSEDYFLRGTMSAEDTINQISDLLTKGWNVSSRFSYTEPIGERSQLSVDYRNTIRKDESDQETFEQPENGAEEYTILNEQLSNVFTNTYLTNQMGGGYRYNKGRDLNIMVRAFFQIADLKSDLTFPINDQIKRRYYSVLPMAMFRYRFSKTGNIRFFYRSGTQSPSVQQLQNVVDNSNPLQLSIGNPDLDQSTEHRISFRYSKTNTDKANIFYFMINGSFTNDYIGTATYLSRSDNPIFEDLDILPGAQLTRPVNLDGYRNFRTFLTYGLPLPKVKVNFNLDLSANYTRTPGLLDDALNYSNNTAYGIGVTFASNISEKVDGTISTRSSINAVNNTLETATDSRYLSQNSKLRLGWILPGGIILRSEIAHQFYSGLSDDFNDDYFLWTAGIGKKLFKNQRGELTLSVVDILNQNRRINRNITDVYIEDVQTNVLQRYMMLKFTYNFLNFNTGKKIPEREDEGDRRRRRRDW